jgi:hypothetical protein
MSDQQVKFEPNKTWVTIATAATAFTTIVGAIVWGTAVYVSQRHFNEAVLQALKDLKVSMDKLSNDGVTTKTATQWIELFRARNPSLTVPDLPR